MHHNSVILWLMLFFFSDKTILKIYDGEVADPRLCKNIEIPRTAQASNVLVSIEQHHRKIMLSIFHLNGHTIGIHPPVQK